MSFLVDLLRNLPLLLFEEKTIESTTAVASRNVERGQCLFAVSLREVICWMHWLISWYSGGILNLLKFIRGYFVPLEVPFMKIGNTFNQKCQHHDSAKKKVRGSPTSVKNHLGIIDFYKNCHVPSAPASTSKNCWDVSVWIIGSTGPMEITTQWVKMYLFLLIPTTTTVLTKQPLKNTPHV